MKIIMICVLFIFIVALEMPRLIRNKKYRNDLIVYGFLTLIAYILNILATFHVYFPMWVLGFDQNL
jgi:hypothetical protein